MRLGHLYWDCTRFPSAHPTGIGRFICALADHRYPLPNAFLLPARLEGGPLHGELARCPGAVRIVRTLPHRHLPWRRRWDQVLGEPGVVLGPGNYHCPSRWPSLLVVHDLIPYLDPGYARFEHCSRAAYGRLLAAASAVLAISAATARSIAETFPGLPPARVLRQGLYAQPPARRPAWVPDGPFYLFVGGAEPRKRVECAVALGSALADGGLVALGGDWANRSMPALLAAWRGPRPALHRARVDDAELEWLYANCRALLYPSRLEGFGLPPLECLRAGRPVVAEAVSSLPEALGDHALWHRFGQDDVVALRHRIDAWTPAADLPAHLATCDWPTARSVLATAVDAAVARAG